MGAETSNQTRFVSRSLPGPLAAFPYLFLNLGLQALLELSQGGGAQPPSSC